jgi:hypothetical protein
MINETKDAKKNKKGEDKKRRGTEYVFTDPVNLIHLMKDVFDIIDSMFKNINS